VTLLSVHALSAFYGDFQALFGVSLDVAGGETVAVIGANGAGKSTFLRALAGTLPVPRETVRFDGQPVGGLPAPALVERGLVLVPEGPGSFRACPCTKTCWSAPIEGGPGRGPRGACTACFPCSASGARSRA